MDDGHLLAPIKEPALRARGYFVYNAETGGERPAVVALRDSLVGPGSLAEAEYPPISRQPGLRTD
jgi:hypothetical protein